MATESTNSELRKLQEQVYQQALGGGLAGAMGAMQPGQAIQSPAAKEYQWQYSADTYDAIKYTTTAGTMDYTIDVNNDYRPPKPKGVLFYRGNTPVYEGQALDEPLDELRLKIHNWLERN